MTTRLEFSAIGATISASVYQWNAATTSWTLLGSISATDTTYDSGYVGVRAGFIANDRSAQFANFNLYAIPEPSAFAGLLGVFTLGFVALRRRPRNV